MTAARMDPTRTDRDPDMVGAEIAMQRAARRVRQRADMATRTADGEGSRERVHGGGASIRHDPREFSFSQAHGYEEVPRPLKLEELPQGARTEIWNWLYMHIKESRGRASDGGYVGYGNEVEKPWSSILHAKHLWFDVRPLDDWDPEFSGIRKNLRAYVENETFNRVFDLVQFFMRHPDCPPEFVTDMKDAFARCRLAYTIDAGPPPTIVPAVTLAEGVAIVESLRQLREAGLEGSAAHLRVASGCINAGDWAAAVRESIHAVESVACQLDPKASSTLKPALASLDKRRPLHPALRAALSKLYGYTSNEQGIRHALLDQAKAQVGRDEAVFMLGACASFASFLWRRNAAGGSS